ncbi:hypothetical protein M3I54_39405 [Paraburkholderia sp. CNPSo 3274]|uniref:hypothetical protein n=1 Tax=Paraburkholderia sp. CNPSo 3274 TaxID=2940932 RepID=UPI0020B81848|nr:hypothetical protein [Paraburkholderia sp. CNPSo 3274]MCP3712896.1 hypothetical protein [Paraburkholderia sp. CNPSo 3274]
MPSYDKKRFSDSDGIASFANLSAGFVTGVPQFITGRSVCDKICSFFATLRQDLYVKQIQDPRLILPGDGKPKDQWDLPVTHKMQRFLIDAGGVSAFRNTTETVLTTQALAEFSTDFVKQIFNVAIVPANVLPSVMKFIQDVGTNLRTSWDNRARSFTITLLGHCHEAVPIDHSGKTLAYIPMVKYFHINVNATQAALTTPYSKGEKITFDFTFLNYVTALKATILDEHSRDYKNFIDFIDKAQGINYRDADNSLEQILDNTVSSRNELNGLGISASEYPKVRP